VKRFAPILALLLSACGGFYASNVGEPSAGEKLRFETALDRVHVGMPEDSLLLLLRPAEKAGEAGILLRSAVSFQSTSRVTYRLGWRSEPRHHGGVKRPEDIDQVRAVVEVREGRVTKITPAGEDD